MRSQQGQSEGIRARSLVCCGRLQVSSSLRILHLTCGDRSNQSLWGRQGVCQRLGAGPSTWLALCELTAIGMIVPVKGDLKKEGFLQTPRGTAGRTGSS